MSARPALLVVLLFLTAPASAQVVPPDAVRSVVNGGPLDYFHARISGSLVSYTRFDPAKSEIRYHDLQTGSDVAVPSG